MEQAIQKAIEGGYRGNFVYQNSENNEWYWNEEYPEQFALLQPLFWQSLGKAMGWNEEKGLCNCGHFKVDHKVYGGTGLHADNILGCLHCSCELYRAPELPDWKDYWHRFIDHLAEGKDVDSFFKAPLDK